MTAADKWTILLSSVGILINVGLFGGLLAQLKQFREATDLDHQRRKREATVDFLMATFGNARELRREGLPALFQSDVDVYASDPLSFADPRNHIIRHYLNEFESLATGMNLGVYEEEVVYSMRSATIVRAWTLYEPWIATRRTFLRQPELYEELEKMASRMQQLQLDKGKPAIEIV